MIFPRIRDLPKEEQGPFRRWLSGIDCPVVDPNLPMSEWDWFWPSDYREWKGQKID